MKRKNITIALIALTILLVVGAIVAVSVLRPVTTEDVRLDTYANTEYYKELPELTPDTKAECLFLGVFRYDTWEEQVLGHTFLTYPVVSCYPLMKFIQEDGSSDVVMVWTNGVAHADSMCWLVALLAVVIVFFSALNNNIKWWPSMIYASGFSLVIIAARIVAAFWYPAVFCVTWLCIAAYFAIPFAFCLQLARFEKIDKEMLKIILSLFFAFYLSVAWSFSYLYYDIIWLALCAAPSMVVLMPRLIDKDRRFKAFSINGSWSKATVVTILSAFLIWMSGISSTLSVDYVKNIFDPDLLDPWGYIYFILPYLVCIETALLNRLKKNTIIIVLAIFFVLYFAFGFTLPVIRDNWATLIFNSVVSMIIFAMIRMWKTMLVFYAILLIINFMPIVGGALFPDSNQLGKPVFIVSLALATAIQLAIYVSRKKLTKHVEIK